GDAVAFRGAGRDARGAGAGVPGGWHYPGRFLRAAGVCVNVTGVELRRIAMPLVAPFRTSFGVERERDVLLVRWVTPDAEGWGECVAMSRPSYSAEYVDGAAEVIRRFLLPALAELSHVDAATVEPVFAKVKGHPMAKAALQTAILDAQLRGCGM